MDEICKFVFDRLPRDKFAKDEMLKYDRKYTFTHIELLVVNPAQGGKRTCINYL